VPERATVTLIPDFAISRLHCRLRPEVPVNEWLAIKIRFEGVPILIENKRAASRRLQGLSYLVATESYVNLARDHAMQQAAVLFQMRPQQQSLILIAASGFYWSCRVVFSDIFTPFPFYLPVRNVCWRDEYHPSLTVTAPGHFQQPIRNAEGGGGCVACAQATTLILSGTRPVL
jgi:hypothetical protein